jgi:hypothetical protein
MTLRDMEATLRQISTDLWVMTVDNPETATVASEDAGLTPRRRELRNIQRMVDYASDSIEDLINEQRGT